MTKNIRSVDIHLQISEGGAFVDHVVRQGDNSLQHSTYVIGTPGRQQWETTYRKVRCLLCSLVTVSDPKSFNKFDITIGVGPADVEGVATEEYRFVIENGKYVFYRRSDSTKRMVSLADIRKILNALFNEGSGPDLDVLGALDGSDMCRPECEGYSAGGRANR